MPRYTAYCPKCANETDYDAPVDMRDFKLAEIPQCCAGTKLRRKMHAARIDVAFSDGNYDVGLGNGPERFSSEADMRKAVDNHNREQAEQHEDGGRQINLVREKS